MIHPLWFTIHFQSSIVRFDLASKSSVIFIDSSFIFDPLETEIIMMGLLFIKLIWSTYPHPMINILI